MLSSAGTNDMSKKAKQKPWSVYMIQCESGKLYTGVSTDVTRRFRQHAGEIKGGAKFFRADPPALLVYEERYSDRNSAQSREAQIKSLPRPLKDELISF